jgi:hypothetical protein
MLTFRPDHNAECLNCDEWLDAHEGPELRCPLDALDDEYLLEQFLVSLALGTTEESVQLAREVCRRGLQAKAEALAEARTREESRRLGGRS